jgi:hypothetical protein
MIAVDGDVDSCICFADAHDNCVKSHGPAIRVSSGPNFTALLVCSVIYRKLGTILALFVCSEAIEMNVVGLG